MEDTTKHCTPCKTKDKKIKPEYYCMDCEAYYCEECFELHPRVPYLAKHIVLKHEDIDIWSRDQYKCSTHSKNLEFFCKEHKMLCCHVCVSLKHRPCTNMDYIQEEAMKKCLDDDKEKMMKQIKEQLQIIESSFDKVKRKVETNQTSKIAYIDDLESFRSRINAVFNSLVEKAFKEMNEKYDKNTKYSGSVSEKLVRFESKLSNLKQQVKSSTVGKEALVYISLQRGEELIEEISRELSKIDFSVGKENYKPVIDGKIEGYVKGINQIAVLENDKMREECVASDNYTEEIEEKNKLEDIVKQKTKTLLRNFRRFRGRKRGTNPNKPICLEGVLEPKKPIYLEGVLEFRSRKRETNWEEPICRKEVLEYRGRKRETKWEEPRCREGVLEKTDALDGKNLRKPTAKECTLQNEQEKEKSTLKNGQEVTIRALKNEQEKDIENI